MGSHYEPDVAAGVSFPPLFVEHSGMNNDMHKEAYVARVRSMALLGADVWEWCRHRKLELSEGTALRILTQAHSKIQLEVML